MTEEKRAQFDVETKKINGSPILKEKGVEPCVIVIFGATGDLTARKLIPAIYNLNLNGSLPDATTVVGVGRRPKSSAEFRQHLREATEEFSRRKPVEKKAWDALAANVEYVSGEYDDPKTFQKLKSQLAEIDRSRGTQGNRLYYMATPPELFPILLTSLVKAGLIYPAGEEPWSRVIIEKPFGKDLNSARELNQLVAKSIDESQTFRIDHYLGKETVQNILVFRFGNSIFEHLWNRKYIDHVQITAAETIGVGHRGSFYDATGVIRDVVQNHLLQILGLVAMEAPASFSPEDIREEKAQLFRSIRPIVGEEAREQVVLGQYQGYGKEEGVSDDSRTPTFAGMKVMVDNWRWQGVPFYLRAGKKLSQRVTEVSVQFQSVPLCLFGQEEACQVLEPNVLTMRIQPDEGISMRFVSKVPGEHLAVGNVFMNMNYAEAFGKPLSDAYERLLLDCIRGDATLFARRDSVETSWKFITPILEAWENETKSFLPCYEPGSEGPKEANLLLSRDGRRWRTLA